MTRATLAILAALALAGCGGSDCINKGDGPECLTPRDEQIHQRALDAASENVREYNKEVDAYNAKYWRHSSGLDND